MLTYHLNLKKYSEDKIALQNPLSFRLVMGVISFIIVFGIIHASSGSFLHVFSRSNLVPMALLLFSILAVLYKDRWIWDRSQGTMQRQFGFLFLYKKDIRSAHPKPYY